MTIDNKLQIELMSRLREGMAKREWGQGDLSRHSGVPQPTISHIISGYHTGSLKTWDKLLAAVNGGSPC